MSNFLPCFLIPCFNHGHTIPQVINNLSSFSLPIILVDDGSTDADTINTLDKVAQLDNVHFLRLTQNSGKGVAVISGLREAQELNYTHAIQIDADGQHDHEVIPELLSMSKKYPNHLISGKPVYDDSIPTSRLIGRYITHFWVWIETLSFTLKDSMCGFRSYPVTQSLAVEDKYGVGERMDFDTDIMVRLYWDGTESKFIDTNVIYPIDGISHFDALKDNILISKMHTRLFFSMLPRIPNLIKRNIQRSATEKHWSQQKEKGTQLGIRLLLLAYSLFGRKIFSAFLYIVMSYYHLVGKNARLASEQYLQQLQIYAKEKNIPLEHSTKLSSFSHFISFGNSMLDKITAWKGNIDASNLEITGDSTARKLIANKQGILVLGSHLGNLELCRALSHIYPDLKINALVFTQHASNFNHVLKSINPDSMLNLLQVDSLGPETAILLQEKIAQGEWVVIVGDRTSTTHESRVNWCNFLGKAAPFAHGPFILASILKAPVYTLFALKNEKNKDVGFHVYFEHFSDELKLPRKNREEAISAAIQKYADRLSYYCLKAPLQWYNFFNFWTLKK